MDKKFDLKNEIEILDNYKRKLGSLLKTILEVENGNVYVEDMLMMSSTNRVISLISGFVLLAKDNNYLCAAPLIRMQIDTCMRTFGITLVNDTQDYFNYYIDGKRIDKYVDRDKKRLKDFYLIKKLDDMFPGVSKVYKEACSYIHLSKNHFFAIKDKEHSKDRKIAFSIGSSDLFDDEFKMNTIRAMTESIDLFINILNGWRIVKEAECERKKKL